MTEFVRTRDVEFLFKDYTCVTVVYLGQFRASIYKNANEFYIMYYTGSVIKGYQKGWESIGDVVNYLLSNKYNVEQILQGTTNEVNRLK